MTHSSATIDADIIGQLPKTKPYAQPGRRTTLRNLAIFTVVVLASGWVGRGVDILMGNTGPETLGMALWLATPFPIALLLRAVAGDGWKDFGIRPNLRGNWVWYGVAVLTYPVVTAIVLLAGRALGLVTFPDISLDALGLIVQAFGVGFLPMIVKNIFEEGAWRGYLAPRLHSLHLSDWTWHLLVGLIWGAWHLPYYFFFLDRAYLAQFTALDLPLYIPLVLVVYVAWAMVYGEIWRLTRSLWPALLMHAVEDAILLPLFERRLIQIVPGADWLVSPMNGLICVLLFVALAMALRQWRGRIPAAA
jgi:membrane protease YdiL (CAAX protease family)